MNLNRIELTLTEADLNALIDRFAPREGRVTRLHIDLREGLLVVTGQVRVILNVPFEVTLRLDAEDSRISAQLVSIKPMRLVTEPFKETILDKIAERLPGAEHRGDALYFDLNTLIQSRGLGGEIRMLSLRTAEGAVTLEFCGSLSLAEVIV